MLKYRISEAYLGAVDILTQCINISLTIQRVPHSSDVKGDRRRRRGGRS
jgi:hypothetical protein